MNQQKDPEELSLKLLQSPKWKFKLENWIRAKEGVRWPKEAMQVRRTLLQKYPIKTSIRPPRNHIASWMSGPYEGKIIWFCLTPTNRLLGYCGKTFFKSPTYWDPDDPEFNFWGHKRGIVIAPNYYDSFKEGIAKLEGIAKRREERKLANVIVHSIPLGADQGPYKKRYMRFFVAKYPKVYSYRVQVFRCVLNDEDEWVFKHNRDIFAWQVKEGPDVYAGFKKLFRKIDKLRNEAKRLKEEQPSNDFEILKYSYADQALLDEYKILDQLDAEEGNK